MKTRTNTITTREEWLTTLAGQMEGIFVDAGYTVPDNYRVTCGFPSQSALARNKRRIGECWDAESSAGKVFEIMISPLLDDPIEIAGVVAHELIHAVVGLKAKHGGPFKSAMKKIGLEGKPTATVPSEQFKSWVQPLLEWLGPYPHQKLIHINKPPKQSTRMLKAECPDCAAGEEPYIVRGSRETFKRGIPRCPIHDIDMICPDLVEEEEDEKEEET